MLLPKPLKNNSVYPRVRAALLSRIGPIRFYNPISAVSWCDIRSEQADADVVRTMTSLRRENDKLGTLDYQPLAINCERFRRASRLKMSYSLYRLANRVLTSVPVRVGNFGA